MMEQEKYKGNLTSDIDLFEISDEYGFSRRHFPAWPRSGK